MFSEYAEGMKNTQKDIFNFSIFFGDFKRQYFQKIEWVIKYWLGMNSLQI
jgi:hypothetical protein